MSLEPLSQSTDYVFREGWHDVRDWSVRTMMDDARVGAVHDVLLDRQGRPRYLDVDLGLFDKHVLLPIGNAKADQGREVVWIPGLASDHLRRVPAYDHDLAALSRGYEFGLVAAYTSALHGEEGSEPRPTFAGAVYGPSEVETPVRPRASGQLAPLSALSDFRIAGGGADPRSWPVILGDGQQIGRIDELLVDTESLKVRYLTCEVDEELLDLDREGRRVPIPTGFARLDEENRRVLVDVLTSREVGRLPLYTGAGFDATVEEEILGHFCGDLADDRFYDRSCFDAGEFYGPEPRA
jgi:hypothetical protein